jgi:hypothetical protein
MQCPYLLGSTFRRDDRHRFAQAKRCLSGCHRAAQDLEAHLRRSASGGSTGSSTSGGRLSAYKECLASMPLKASLVFVTNSQGFSSLRARPSGEVFLPRGRTARADEEASCPALPGILAAGLRGGQSWGRSCGMTCWRRYVCERDCRRTAGL